MGGLTYPPGTNWTYHENNLLTATWTVAGGAVGYVDTDISGSLTTAALAFFVCVPGGNQNFGVSQDGSTENTYLQGGKSGYPAYAGCCPVVGGIVRFYRAAANNVYYLVRYLTE